MTEKTPETPDKTSVAAYLDLWEQHAIAVFRDNSWLEPRLGPAPKAKPEPGDHPVKATTNGRQDG